MTARDLNHWDDLINLSFDGGYPAEAAERLFDELDFQRAVQVYLWALPTMNVDAMRRDRKPPLAQVTTSCRCGKTA